MIVKNGQVKENKNSYSRSNQENQLNNLFQQWLTADA